MAKLPLLVFCVAACGDNHGVAVDGSIDTPLGSDAAPDATPTGPVAVTRMIAGLPVVGADVVFVDPLGQPFAHVTTDTHGKASYDLVPLGSSVTVIDPLAAMHYELWSILSVHPGDDLVIGNPYLPTLNTNLGTITVHLPSAQAGAASYTVQLGCVANPVSVVNATAPVTASLDSSCLNDSGNYDVLALALDGAGVPIAFTIALANLPATTDVVMNAWQTSLSTLPTILRGAAPTATTSLFSITMLDGNATFQLPLVTAALIPAQDNMALYPYPAGFGDRMRVFVETKNTVVQELGMFVSSGPPITSATIDLAMTIPPVLENVKYEILAGTTTPHITWTTATGLAAVDELSFGIDSIAPDLVTTEHWNIAVPPSAGPVDLPGFPDDLAVHRMHVGQKFEATFFAAVDWSFVDGYAGVRPRPWWVPMTSTYPATYTVGNSFYITN